jgi:hypothetical protein
MTTVLQMIDTFLCVLVIVAAAEYLRRVRPIEQPLLSISFYLVAIAAFGGFVSALQSACVSPYTVLLHAGVVVYAWARRGHLFEVVTK